MKSPSPPLCRRGRRRRRRRVYSWVIGWQGQPLWRKVGAALRMSLNNGRVTCSCSVCGMEARGEENGRVKMMSKDEKVSHSGSTEGRKSALARWLGRLWPLPVWCVFLRWNYVAPSSRPRSGQQPMGCVTRKDPAGWGGLHQPGGFIRHPHRPKGSFHPSWTEVGPSLLLIGSSRRPFIWQTNAWPFSSLAGSGLAIRPSLRRLMRHIHHPHTHTSLAYQIRGSPNMASYCYYDWNFTRHQVWNNS